MIKNRKLIYNLYNKNKEYSLLKAINIILKIGNTIYNKCISSIDISINFYNKNKIFNNFIFKKIIELPYNNGKKYKYLILTNNKKDIKYIKNMGIKYVGGIKYINKIKKGWLNFDFIITIPFYMKNIIKLGKILGPKNLIPNALLGNITNNPINTLKKIKKGKILLKMDKFKIINCSIGRSNFSIKKIKNNIKFLLKNIINTKPFNNNKNFIKNIFLSTTYSPSIKIKKIW
ncbi:MAG: 50S ribosomal protein L1 [Candidatus Shikimatogenerans sp. Tcar]|uniref:Ribosomal protein n=1 Tax=Candidatus Shikimatogenerans sp. Tcar TaxID=3158565 RepID=A0AAU7QUM2_9FLAO